MSTVSESNPWWAITSAENELGIDSQPFTTASPRAQMFLSVFSLTMLSSSFRNGGGDYEPSSGRHTARKLHHLQILKSSAFSKSAIAATFAAGSTRYAFIERTERRSCSLMAESRSSLHVSCVTSGSRRFASNRSTLDRKSVVE